MARRRKGIKVTKQELNSMKRAVRQVVKRAKEDPELALSILYGTGMYTKKGNLKRKFK